MRTLAGLSPSTSIYFRRTTPADPEWETPAFTETYVMPAHLMRYLIANGQLPTEEITEAQLFNTREKISV